jgi:hypothetical protein
MLLLVAMWAGSYYNAMLLVRYYGLQLLCSKQL